MAAFDITNRGMSLLATNRGAARLLQIVAKLLQIMSGITNRGNYYITGHNICIALLIILRIVLLYKSLFSFKILGGMFLNVLAFLGLRLLISCSTYFLERKL